MLAGVVGTGAGLAGCASAPAVGTKAKRMRIFSPSLYGARHALLVAWRRDGAPFPVEFVPGISVSIANQPFASGEMPPPHADVVEVSQGGMVDLHPYLKGANLDLGRLLPQVVARFTAACGAVTALPVGMREVQFYVNDSLLRKLKVGRTRPWSFSAVIAALAAHRASTTLRAGPPLVGLGWGDLNLWGALVLGLGGALARNGALDFVAAATATANLASIGTRYGWSAGPSANAVLFDFERHGFKGSRSASCVFAFMPPGVPAGTERPEPFPTLPRMPAVPAWHTTGLAAQPHSHQAAALVRFMGWLYAPAQQRLLATLGLPPVLAAQALRDFWHRGQGKLPAAAARFQFRGYTDVPYQIRQALHAPGMFLSQTPASLTRIGAGANAAAALARWQRTLESSAAALSQPSPGCHMVHVVSGPTVK